MPKAPGVRKHRDGWEARVQVNGNRMSVMFDTYADAVAWRAEQVPKQGRSRMISISILNRPGYPGGSTPWKRGWSHGQEADVFEAVPA